MVKINSPFSHITKWYQIHKFVISKQLMVEGMRKTGFRSFNKKSSGRKGTNSNKNTTACYNGRISGLSQVMGVIIVADSSGCCCRVNK